MANEKFFFTPISQTIYSYIHNCYVKYTVQKCSMGGATISITMEVKLTPIQYTTQSFMFSAMVKYANIYLLKE